jgi:transcription elongation GreA/GreB family factor
VNKQKLLEQLQERLQQKVDATLNAVNEAHALASHEQSKPENQYDTLALEAAYLAHGQSARIAELQKQMILLNHLEFIELSQESPIALGALICIEELGLESQWLWLLPVAGGEQLNLEDKHIRTITPEAPLAEKLIGQYLGDEVVLNLGHKKKQFEVIELL